MLSVIPFLGINVLGTFFVLRLPESFYGLGFVLASVTYYIIAEARLFSYTARLDFFILTKQPVFIAKKRGFFSKLVSKLETKLA